MAVSGSASVIHQVAISTMIAVVRQAAGGMPAGRRQQQHHDEGGSPPQRPQRAAMHFPLEFGG